MDKITAKIRNYRSTVRYATEAEAKAAMEKKIKQSMENGFVRKYRVVAWVGAFCIGGKVDGVFYTVERA